jgi:rod shape-determining protein MreD
MHWLRLTGILLIAALIQAAVLPALAVNRARPDLLFIIAIYVVVREPLRERGRWQPFWVGWISGLMIDAFSAGSDLPLGSHALVFGVAALLIARLGADLFIGSIVAQVIIVGLAAFGAHATLQVALAVRTAQSVTALLGLAMSTACYTGAVAPLMFVVLRPLEKFLGVRSRRSFGRA